jgi:hypothetical protein
LLTKSPNKELIKEKGDDVAIVPNYSRLLRYLKSQGL